MFPHDSVHLIARQYVHIHVQLGIHAHVAVPSFEFPIFISLYSVMPPSLSLSPLSLRALMTKLLNPLQTKIEEWKKTAVQMDREHDKGACFHFEFIKIIL